MTDRSYTDLRAALDARAKGGSAGYERYLDKATPETIRALLADYDRMRDALDELRRGFVAARGNAEAMFRESGSIYHEGRRVAYDQAFTDVREALAQEES